MIDQKIPKSSTHRTTFALCLFLGGLATLIPYSNVLHPSLLGYNALCSFVPMSTAMLWGLAGFIFLQPIRMRNRKPWRCIAYAFSIALFFYSMLHSGYLGMIGLLSWETNVFPIVSLEKVSNGVYTGESNNIGKKVIMQVEVQDKKILGLKTISMGHASPFGQEAFKHLPGRILQAQSIKVDSITGATHSCQQIKAAIHNALQGNVLHIKTKNTKRFLKKFKVLWQK